MNATVVLGRQGRLVVPVEVRQKLGLREGDTLDLTISEGAVTLSRRPTRSEAIDAAHGALSTLAPERSLVDELIADRRAEAAQG